MKIKCDFCKTEYTLDHAPTGPVQCAICGHTWTIMRPARRNTLLVFIASLCALLAALVFAFVVITQHSATRQELPPLVANVTSIQDATDESGNIHYVVTGNVINQSDDIYGVPDLILVFRDGENNIIGEQHFMPSATLLDPGASITFTHTLTQIPVGTKKISADLQLPQQGGKQ